VAVDARTHHVFVANWGDNTVSMVDAANGRVVRVTAVGHTPSAVVVAGRAHRAFVLNVNPDSVSVLDTGWGMVLRTVPFSNLRDVAVDERTGHVFVLDGPDGVHGRAVMLDARSGTVVHTAALGKSSRPVAINSRTQRAFVPNFEDDTVSMLDTVTGRVVRTVRVGSLPYAVAVDERTSRAFVINNLDRSVSMLDARSGAVLRTVAVGRNPQTLAVDMRRGYVFVVNEDAGTVSVLDARTGAVRRTVAVGAFRPRALCGRVIDVLVDEHRGHAFVLNGGAADSRFYTTNGSMSVLDVASGRVVHTLPVGHGPTAMAVDERTAHVFVVNNGSTGQRGGQDLWGWVPAAVRRRVPWLPGPSPSTIIAAGTVTVLDTARV
jgi:YVTN family beta-propeller protein